MLTTTLWYGKTEPYYSNAIIFTLMNVGRYRRRGSLGRVRMLQRPPSHRKRHTRKHNVEFIQNTRKGSWKNPDGYGSNLHTRLFLIYQWVEFVAKWWIFTKMKILNRRENISFAEKEHKKIFKTQQNCMKICWLELEVWPKKCKKNDHILA